MTKVAVFDRDGTIVDVVRDEEIGAISVAFHPNQLRFLPGALDGMRAFARDGFALAIATNQPAPAKGQFSADAVRRTNDALVDMLAREGIVIAALEACMHHAGAGCSCRKPMPGMLESIAARLGADRAASWMIGDSAADLQAGRAAGMRTALVFPTHRCELCPLRHGPAHLAPDAHAPTIADLARSICYCKA